MCHQCKSASEHIRSQDRVQYVVSDYIRRCIQPIQERNDAMIKVSTSRLVKLLEAMSTCQALGTELMGQAHHLLAIVCADEHDVTVVRTSLDAVGNKKANGILFTFQALGKHFIIQARQNLSDSSSDDAINPVVAHLKDLTVALNATRPADGWLAPATNMVENIGQIARAGSRSLKHRVIGDVREAYLALQRGVSQLNSDCAARLDVDIAERICSIAVAERNYDGLITHMVSASTELPELKKDLHLLSTQIAQDIVEPLLVAMAVPFMAESNELQCWRLLADGTAANDKKYDAWSTFVDAVGKGSVAHSDVQDVASTFNTYGYDRSHLEAIFCFGLSSVFVCIRC